MKKQLLSLSLTLAVVVAGSVATYALLADAHSSSGADPIAASGPLQPMPSPTPTVASPAADSRAAIDASLATESPPLAKAVTLIEQADIASLFALMTWKDFPCTPAGNRGGFAPFCSDLGVAGGTLIPEFQYLTVMGAYFPKPQLTERLTHFLAGRTPSLALVVRRSDGTGRVSFTLSDNANEGLRGIDFEVDFNSATPLLGFVDRFYGSTPLDTIREEGRQTGSTPAVLYMSPAMSAWETAKDQAQRSPQAGPGVTSANP